MTFEDIRSPYPYFGGKSAIAPAVWARFGDVRNFVEPFMGSNSLLLARPHWDWQRGDWKDDETRIETVNDADSFVSNFWRAISADPDAVAYYADWPVLENDLHARHAWLVGKREGLAARLEGDPDFYDARIAGWWCWGMCCWIGSGFCSGDGPWSVVEGQLVHLGDAGRGVNRQLVANTNDSAGIYGWFRALANRLRRVRVCCGDWSRVCGPTPTIKQGLTAVFLDPPYGHTTGRTAGLYAVDDLSIASAVRRWAVEWGDHPDMRIALCGYEGEHEMPEGWTALHWKAHGGYGGQGEGVGRANSSREVIWFSPNCLRPEDPVQLGLFGEETSGVCR